jgi:hypothetical protein
MIKLAAEKSEHMNNIINRMINNMMMMRVLAVASSYGAWGLATFIVRDGSWFGDKHPNFSYLFRFYCGCIP